jgi:hypothetical protein
VTPVKLKAPVASGVAVPLFAVKVVAVPPPPPPPDDVNVRVLVDGLPTMLTFVPVRLILPVESGPTAPPLVPVKVDVLEVTLAASGSGPNDPIRGILKSSFFTIKRFEFEVIIRCENSPLLF